MSADINVYCTKLSADLVPQIITRLNDCGMVVEVHPDFRFDQTKDSGFVPFKFRLLQPQLELLEGKELKSGFELYITDFDLQTEKAQLQTPPPSFFEKLLGKKQFDNAFAPSDIERRLQDCKKVVTFVWSAADSFEFRFAALTSAIVTELTDGVCFSTVDGMWHDATDIVSEAFRVVQEYEQHIQASDIQIHEFKEW